MMPSSQPARAARKHQYQYAVVLVLVRVLQLVPESVKLLKYQY
jgi:hypothetical protein